MLKRFLLFFLLFPLPAVLSAGFAFLFKDQLSDNVIMGGAVAICILGFPYFFYLVHRVFLFKAISDQRISEHDLLEKVSQLTFQDTKMSLTREKGRVILSPPNTDETFLGLLSARNIKHTYSMTLWFDEKKHLVRFKDKVVSTELFINPGRFRFKFQLNSGLVAFNIKLLNAHGELVSFSNKELHGALIKVANDNGWDVSLKVI